MKNVLTIAASDSSGGSGIQADIKTFSAHGIYGMSVITAVTAQNTEGIISIQKIDPIIIKQQIDSIFSDIKVDAVKIGMVFDVDTIRVIADRLKYYKPRIIVLDPVMLTKDGYEILKSDTLMVLIKELIPLAMIITPNLYEAEKLAKIEIKTPKDIIEACKIIKKYGSKYVLIKCGDIEFEPVDVLYDGENFYRYESIRINTKNTHGSGSTHSAAITANLAVSNDIRQAVSLSKKYISGAIQKSFDLGKGRGSVNHFYKFFQK